MVKTLQSLSLSRQILLSIALAVVAGFILKENAQHIAFIGSMWINALKIGVVPLVLVMLVMGVASQTTGGFGKTSVRILVYYMGTTVIAGLVGIAITTLLNPGSLFTAITADTAAAMKSADMSPTQFFLGVIPSNFLKPLVEGNMLQVLVIAILMGIALMRMSNQSLKTGIIGALEKIQALFSGFMELVIKCAPIGVFCTVAAVIGSHGKEAIGALSGLLGTFLLGLVCHILIVYCPTVWIADRITPWRFIKSLFPMFGMAISTCSSLLCIPVDEQIVNEEYKVDPSISSFTIPLGSTINMDGGAMLYPCVIVFTAQAAGIDLSFGTLFYMSIVGALISSAGGGFYGGALVKLMFMAEIFGVPGIIVTMIGSVFSILDMFITSVNCAGDIAGTVLVDRMAIWDRERAARKGGGQS